MPLKRLSALTALLVLMLTLVGIVQWRQSELISQATLRSGDDKLNLMYQAAYEYLRMRSVWHDASHAAPAVDTEEVRMRYEIFVSRIELLRTIASQVEEPHGSQLQGAVASADRFISKVDQHSNAGANADELRDRLGSLAPELAELDAAIRGVTVLARRIATDTQTSRNELVRRHFLIGIALTLFLSVLTAILGAVMIRLLSRGERRRVELESLAVQLRQARSEAEAASAAKTAFLANMSHEIRTPFQGVIGMLALLRDSPLTAEQQAQLRTAQTSADHLLAILNDILDLSRMESDRVVMTPVATELRTLWLSVDALMRPLADRKQLTFELTVAKDLPSHALLDPIRVRQVLFNLVANAIKFTELGGVELRVCVRQQPGEPAQLAIEVRDTGIGMSVETLERLFQRFSQGDDSLSRRFGGTGLGLEISRRLARLMGGDITVTSTLGLGSTFCFSTPLHAVETTTAAPADETPPRVLPTAPEPGAAGTPRSLRVLVAEDNEVNRLYMQALLERLGHEPTFACDGARAVDMALAGDYDLILMDLHMPELDGFAATRAIRDAEARTGHRRMIAALTADAFGETCEKCRLAGMDDFLVKPLRPEEMSACLHRLMAGQAPWRAVEPEAVA